MNQLSKDEAIAFGEAKQWEPMTPRERAEFQMNQELMCMPFGVFHEAIEAALGRPVFTHEFALNSDGLKRELLERAPSPTMDDIVEMIPENKRMVIEASYDAP